MNKKQGAIIVTLLVLIILAGVLATKSNSPLSTLNDSDSNKGAISSLKTSDTTKKSTSKTSFFSESRLNREQKQQKALADLKVIIEDKNITKEDKQSAINKYTEIATAEVYENKIENALKGNGYSDVYCSQEEDGLRIIIKSNEKLTDKQKSQIKNVALSVVKAKDIEIDEQK